MDKCIGIFKIVISKKGTIFLQKALSIEHRKKISLSKIGNKVCLGRKLSKKTIEKIRKKRLWYKHSKETKDKISKSAKRNYRLRKIYRNGQYLKDFQGQ